MERRVFQLPSAAMVPVQVVALEAEREYLAAAADARLYRTESRWAWSRLHRLQWALEQRTGEWHVAEVRWGAWEAGRQVSSPGHAVLRPAP